MPTLAEIQAKNAALKAAAADGAVPPVPTQIASSIQTGVQGSAESAGTVIVPQPVSEESEIDQERLKNSLGVFRAIFLRKYFTDTGARVEPTKGYYYAESINQLINLKHFAVLGKVEEVVLAPAEESKQELKQEEQK